jgi:hypothetical protein
MLNVSISKVGYKTKTLERETTSRTEIEKASRSSELLRRWTPACHSRKEWHKSAIVVNMI